MSFFFRNATHALACIAHYRGDVPFAAGRRLADTLASIQIRLLGDETPVGAMAEEATQQLFTALRHSLPSEQYQAILAHSGRAVVAWQQARRPAS